jgi:hypothetical protein
LTAHSGDRDQTGKDCVAYPWVATSNDVSEEIPHMQAILILSPILVCAFVTGVLLMWVLFVTLPRMRRAEKGAPPASRPALRTTIPPRSTKSSIVDADQEATGRNV